MPGRQKPFTVRTAGNPSLPGRKRAMDQRMNTMVPGPEKQNIRRDRDTMPYNKDQLKAIQHKDGPCLVLAGPGSGKTAVISGRARYLTETLKVPPENILVVTFTNAAANEMRNRYLQQAEEDKTAITFGTFHAVFYTILKQHLPKKPEVISEGESIRLLSDVFREHFREFQMDQELITGLLSEISSARNRGLYGNGYEPKEKRVDFEKAAALFEEKKRRAGKIDFEDMLLMTRELLRTDPEALKTWRKKYRYIMVDEFQDINPVQYEIIRLLAEPENNLFIVGDDDQSVYAFRGAEPSIMLDFPKDYRDCEIVSLSVNYRSSEEIVQRSQKLIRHNKNRYKKKMVPEKGSLYPVEKMKFTTESDECRYLAEAIEKEAKEGIPLHEIAVLTRTNAGMTPVVTALTEARIPFYSRDKVQNIYRHFIMKPVFGMINWAEGNRTRENFLKFMNCPNRYIRREDLRTPLVSLDQMRQMYAESRDRQYMEEKIEYLSYQLSLLQKLSIPYAMINFIRKFMEYDAYARTQAEERRIPEASLLSVLDEVQETAKAFKTVPEWYQHITDVTYDLEALSQRAPDMKKDHVMLSTFHSAKGLEYRSVYIPDVNESVIPHEKALSEEALEEERRMFYVAVTRASERLHLLSVEERYGKRVALSRYLKEMS